MMPETQTKILVTVGTTDFDGLIEYTDSQAFIELITQGGYQESDVLYQIGTTGKIIPTHANQFRLNPNIQQVYDSHEIVITHGGAGTLLACLHDDNPKKKIIAVANTTLAGNHQTELIDKLHQQQYIIGFDSVQSFKRGSNAVLQLLKGELKLKKYSRANKSVLNCLVFGQDL